MASLNWNAFLTDDLSLPHDQWTDIPSTTTRSSVMPSPNTSRAAVPGTADLDSFERALNDLAADASFDDSLFNTNDYFLSDLEVLQPLGDGIAGESTSESSPEPLSSISMTGPNPFQIKREMSSKSQTPASTSTTSKRSPSMPTIPETLQRAHSFPNPAYESMFPNNLESGFVEDLTFPKGPIRSASSSNDDADVEVRSNSETTTKRNRGKPDILSACWTSPLCPNHNNLDGSPPDPSTCGGGCAPFLFASDDALPTSTVETSLLEQDMTTQDSPEGEVELLPRSRKRTESDASSTGPPGRTFPKTTAKSKAALKLESPKDDSPPLVDNDKPKSRRRLPHNQVERKYRESLNTQLESLRRVVPALSQKASCDGADIEDLPAPSKPSKAVVLASATAYIKQMEKERKSMAEENQKLRQRVKTLQALVKCDDCSLMQYVMDLKIQQPS